MHVQSISAAIVMGVSLVGAGATAVLAGNAPGITINHKDLDLTQEADAKIMLQRIKDAARRICDVTATADLTTKTARQACVQETANDAVASLHSPLVTALNGADQTPVT